MYSYLNYNIYMFWPKACDNNSSTFWNVILVTNLDIVSLCESCLRNTNSVEPINFITIQFNIIIIMIEAHKYVIYIMLYACHMEY